MARDLFCWGVRHRLQLARFLFNGIFVFLPWEALRQGDIGKTGKDVTVFQEEVRPVVQEAVRKIHDQIFPDGMPWGTKFSSSKRPETRFLCV